jgi:hypothetical protein
LKVVKCQLEKVTIFKYLGIEVANSLKRLYLVFTAFYGCGIEVAAEDRMTGSWQSI